MDYAKTAEGTDDTNTIDLFTKEHALEAAKSASSPVRELLEALIGKVKWTEAKPEAKAAKK